MSNLHKYVDNSEKTGYYIRTGFDNNIITYQVPEFAEEIIIQLGYEDGEKLPGELFYLMLNFNLIYTEQSGINPVSSFDDLPDFDSEEMTSLSSNMRKRLVELLYNHDNLTPQQQSDLKRYTSSQNIDLKQRKSRSLNSNSSAERSANSSESSKFGVRNDACDEYMLAVDLRRLLKPAVEQLEPASLMRNSRH